MKKLFITDMKYAKISFFFLLSFVLFFSCSQKETESILPNQIVLGSEKVFSLDSTSTSELIQNQILKTDSATYLATMDLSMNYINLFDWESGEISDKIKINIGDGPDQVLTPTNFFIHNLDSIFVQDMRVGIKLMNQNGQVYQNFQIGEVSIETNEYEGLPAYFFATSSRPISFYEGKIYYPTTHIGIDKPILGVYDIRSNKLEEHFNFPIDGFGNTNDLYENIYRVVYLDWSSNKDELYFSFPIRNEIYKSELVNKSLSKLNLKDDLNIDFSGHFNVLFSDLRELGFSEEAKKEGRRRVDIFEKNKSFSSIFACDSLIYRVLIHEKKESNTNSFNIDLYDFEVFAYKYNGELLARSIFKNPQEDGSVLLVNRTENFLIKNDNMLYVSILKQNQLEDELIYKRLILK